MSIPNADHMMVAWSFAGVREITGPKSHPEIIAFIRKYQPNWDDDSTIAWCSIFMNVIAVSCCLENTEHLRPMVARDWLKVGEPVALDDLQVGDVVIFWRGTPDGWQGHVTFYLRRNGDVLTCFGGNQSNAIQQSNYAVSRFLGGRRLRPLDQLRSHAE